MIRLSENELRARALASRLLLLDVDGVMIDGGLRPRFVLPAAKLHRSEKLSFEQLALVETLAIGCHAVQRS